MIITSRAQDLVDLAHRHLDAAAHVSLGASGDVVTGSAFAAQIQLAAAALPPAAGSPSDSPAVAAADAVTTHLREALSALDQVPPLEGPPDLPLCAWHIHELLRIASRPGAA